MTTKRFIAGAFCPSCGAQDSIRMFEHNGQSIRECVDCNFSDTQADMPTLKAGIPATRMSLEEDGLSVTGNGTETRVIHILDDKASR